MGKSIFSDLGQIVSTCGIAAAIEEDPKFQEEINSNLQKYSVCDWGDTCEEDGQLNDEALKIGDRILALYKTSRGNVFIITESDRSVTTILFASEY